MKKIITKEQQLKKNKKNQLIIGIILIALMVFSTLGYALTGRDNETDSESKIDYNGVEFIKDSGYWYFNIQGYDFMTKYNPQEIEKSAPLVFLNINNYIGKPLYFVGSGEGIYEIGRNLNQFILRIQEVCLSEENCEKDLPIKNCSVDNIIIFEEIKENMGSIYSEENCVFIQSNLENQIMYADSFLYKILGI